jgi:hypothetical protein
MGRDAVPLGVRGPLAFSDDKLVHTPGHPTHGEMVARLIAVVVALVLGALLSKLPCRPVEARFYEWQSAVANAASEARHPHQ